MKGSELLIYPQVPTYKGQSLIPENQTSMRLDRLRLLLRPSFILELLPACKSFIPFLAYFLEYGDLN